MNWIETTVGDYCPFIYGKGLPQKKRLSGPFKVYGSNGCVDYHNESYVNGPGIIIGRKGSVGAVHLSLEPFWPIDTSFYIEKESIEELWFAYYLIKSLGLENMNSDSAVPGLNRDNAHALPIKIPEKEEDRKALGKWISKFDDKIKVNNQLNQTLEQIAQAIFKSWFVDFEPVKAKMAVLEAGDTAEQAELAAMSVISAKDETALKQLQADQPEAYAELAQTAALFPSAMEESELGAIPEGWSVGKLADLIDFNPKRTLRRGTSAPYLDMKNVPTSGHLAVDVIIREITSGTKFVNGDTLLARITPCLENGKTAYVDFLDDNQVGWGSTEYIVMRPHEGYPTSVGYFLARDSSFRMHAIQSMTGTSGRQRANAKALAELPWLIYPKVLIKVFDKTAKQYLNMAKNNGDESKLLSVIRDTLLPKLLSGEIDLSQLHAAAEQEGK